MKFYWKMPKGLRPIFVQELQQYKTFLEANEFDRAWHRLERAHIIGQPWAIEHTYVHWRMLLFGFKIKSRHEIVGQLPRLLVGGIKSFVGKIPVGNTGGANVPPLKTMAIPEDLEVLMKLSDDAGESDFQITAGSEGARVVIYAAQPQHHEIVSHGPFIADSMDDIRQLYSDYRAGRMGHIHDLPKSSSLCID